MADLVQQNLQSPPPQGAPIEMPHDISGLVLYEAPWERIFWFVIFAVACLGLGFLIWRFSGKLRQWREERKNRRDRLGTEGLPAKPVTLPELIGSEDSQGQKLALSRLREELLSSWHPKLNHLTIPAKSTGSTSLSGLTGDELQHIFKTDVGAKSFLEASKISSDQLFKWIKKCDDVQFAGVRLSSDEATYMYESARAWQTPQNSNTEAAP